MIPRKALPISTVLALGVLVVACAPPTVDGFAGYGTAGVTEQPKAKSPGGKTAKPASIPSDDDDDGDDNDESGASPSSCFDSCAGDDGKAKKIASRNAKCMAKCTETECFQACGEKLDATCATEVDACATVNKCNGKCGDDKGDDDDAPAEDPPAEDPPAEDPLG